MDWESTQILYRSEDYLQRLHRQVENTPDEVQIRSGEELQGAVEGKVGLAEIIALVPGIKLEGKVAGKAKSFNEEVRIETTDTIDQELAIADRLADSDLPSPETIDETDIGVPHYFAGKVQLSNNIQEGSIIVEYETEDITITGSTSEDNWISPSVLDNLLIGGPCHMYGLFIPFDISSKGDTLEVTAQYIIIILSNNG